MPGREGKDRDKGGSDCSCKRTIEAIRGQKGAGEGRLTHARTLVRGADEFTHEPVCGGRAHTHAHLDIATRERAPEHRDDIPLAPKSARSGPSIETRAGALKAAALQVR